MRRALAGAVLAATLLTATVGRSEGLSSPCLQPRGAGRARCGSAPAPSPPPAWAPPAPGDLGGAYGLYRTLGRSEVRRCRLQPTCSLFAVQAVRRMGVLLGMLFTLARVQMEHGPQGGWLRMEMASDGDPVYDDPVSAWDGP